jgi:hypothetical protein
VRALLVILLAASSTCQSVRDWGAGRVRISQACLDSPLARECSGK